MKNRYEKIVFEAEEGITFEVLKGMSGELIIRAVGIDEPGIENYENPPILEGYKYVCGKWNNGFVIERLTDKSQFVWIPVMCLDNNGSLVEDDFRLPFGRRNYQNDERADKNPYEILRDKFSNEEFNETLTDELVKQYDSVRKYGGFYISRYDISENAEGKPRSIKGAMPWVRISFFDAMEVASSMESSETVKSHLTYGAEYDSILEWFIESNARNRCEIVGDSSNWGNYRGAVNSPREVVPTGSNEKWCINNIYDLAGNIDEWTQEQYGSSMRVRRGGSYNEDGYNMYVAHRNYSNPKNDFVTTGFRVALYIK